MSLRRNICILGNSLTRLHRYNFNYKRVFMLNCGPERLQNPDITFEKTEVLIMVDCHSNFVHDWLKPCLFPSLKKIYFSSKLNSLDILTRFHCQNTPIYLADKYRLLKETEEKVIPLDHVIIESEMKEALSDERQCNNYDYLFELSDNNIVFGLDGKYYVPENKRDESGKLNIVMTSFWDKYL